MSDRTFDDDRDRSGENPRSDDSSRSADTEDDDEPSVERATENVLDPWPTPALDDPPATEIDEPEELRPTGSAWSAAGRASEPTLIVPTPVSEPASEPEPATGGWEEESVAAVVVEPEEVEAEEVEVAEGSVETVIGLSEHAPGELRIPSGVPVLEGEIRGERRAVGIVVSRFNGHVTSRLLESALAELELHGVERASITVMPVPGAFELPIAAMALAKTRRFACILALGCVIRGDTPHFDYVASEAASGLQLAAIETGVPVAFGLLTLDRSDQAEARYDKGAEAVRTGLEMADVFANLRAAAAR
jgi:6,7-dimethyl-8-ribityllumazine synthase